MAIPATVQRLLHEWHAGELACADVATPVLRALTSSNVDAIMAALPDDVREEVVHAGCYNPRPGEPVVRLFFGTAVGPVDLGPPVATEEDWSSEAVAAFDDWYRAAYGREARGPVNRGIAALCGELLDHVGARDVSRDLYDTAMRTAEELVPKDASDREKLLERVRWFEQWIDVGPGGYPPGLEPPTRKRQPR